VFRESKDHKHAKYHILLAKMSRIQNRRPNDPRDIILVNFHLSKLLVTANDVQKTCISMHCKAILLKFCAVS